jgi:hypothetical protein
MTTKPRAWRSRMRFSTRVSVWSAALIRAANADSYVVQSALAPLFRSPNFTSAAKSFCHSACRAEAPNVPGECLCRCCSNLAKAGVHRWLKNTNLPNESIFPFRGFGASSLLRTIQGNSKLFKRFGEKNCLFLPVPESVRVRVHSQFISTSAILPPA